MKLQNYSFFNKIQIVLIHRTALHLAVMKGNLKIIDLLLQHEDINTKIKDDQISNL